MDSISMMYTILFGLLLTRLVFCHPVDEEYLKQVIPIYSEDFIDP